jgi:hypothetical protein
MMTQKDHPEAMAQPVAHVSTASRIRKGSLLAKMNQIGVIYPYSMEMQDKCYLLTTKAMKQAK